ncbi:MAG: C25 family cysteine peptidase, partial [Cyclobacteriaceae bacterium]
LTVRVNTTGFDGAADRVSTALLRVKYPQDVSMVSSENKIFRFEGLGTSERAYLRISETSNADTDIYEITDPLAPVRLVTTHFSDRVEAIIPASTTERDVLAVNINLSAADIEPVTFVEPNVTSLDYLIISHPSLRMAASDGLDPVQAFADYRASVAGGQHTSAIFDIFDIYDQFNFGDISSIAIRRLIQYADANGNPEAVFLIGKGRTPDENFYRTQDYSVVNIPTYGSPGSDLKFVQGVGSDPIKPGLPIGRLNAFESEDVKAYLDKVKEMEALPYDDLFRKNVLQLSGGQTSVELSIFKLYINNFRDDLEGDFLGGKAINVGKETSQEVEVVDVVQEINDGVGLVTFFGHSSGSATDIEIGRVTDGEFGYNNPGKYPVFLVNGCNAGDIFGTNFTFGEDWMRAPGLGAIGFIAHADFASSTGLKRWSDLFYQVSFKEENFFGSTLGEIMIECSDRYFDLYGTSDLAKTQVLQMLLQGDPMVRLFAAAQPDYEILDVDLTAESYSGGPLLAALDSFKINLPVKNFGRTITDSLLVQVRRTLPQGEIIDSYAKFLRPLRLDTLEFKL